MIYLVFLFHLLFLSVFPFLDFSVYFCAALCPPGFVLVESAISLVLVFILAMLTAMGVWLAGERGTKLDSSVNTKSLITQTFLL